MEFKLKEYIPKQTSLMLLDASKAYGGQEQAFKDAISDERVDVGVEALKKAVVRQRRVSIKTQVALDVLFEILIKKLKNLTKHCEKAHKEVKNLQLQNS